MGPRELLRVTPFRRLYAARLTSQLADGAFTASLINFVVFNPQKAPDASAIAASLAAVILPFTVVGPFAGIALDRLSRQRTLVVGSAARGLLCLGVAALMAAGHRGADLFVLTIGVLSVSRLVLSALSAAMPLTLARPAPRTLITAGALSTTSGTVVGLLGAAIGTGVRSLAGDADRDLAAVALTAALGYAIASLTALRLERRALGPTDPAPFAGALAEARLVVSEVAEGAVHLWRARQARDALLALSAHRFCYGLSFVTTILLYRSFFSTAGSSGNLTGLGTIVGVAGAGTFLAAVLTPRATARWGRHAWATGTLAACAVAEVSCGPWFREAPFLAAAFVIGFGAQAVKLCCDSLVQQTVADAFRGRAFSFYDLAFNVCYLIAAGVAALILPRDGHSQPVVVLLTIGYAVAALTYGLLGSRDPAPEPAEAAEAAS